MSLVTQGTYANPGLHLGPQAPVPPHCRNHLDCAMLYGKNWGKGLRRSRALPVPWEVLLGMVAVAHAYGDERFGVSILVGFLCLLRTG